jgi:hypothetical protein
VARAIKRIADAGARSTELEALGHALAQLDPSRAVSQFRDWIQPDKLLRRVRATPSPLWQVAISSMATVPGEDAGDLLQWIHARADGDLKMNCIQSMARQKELGKSG